MTKEQITAHAEQMLVGGGNDPSWVACQAVARSYLELRVAAEELERLKEAVWPGLPNFEPTPEQPQQNFYEAVAEGFRNEKAVIPAPPVGTLALCLICAYEKPWGIWGPTGAAVCVECRDKARQ